MSRDANVNTAINNLVEGYTAQTANGTTVTLTVGSAYQQYFTSGSTATILKLPLVSTLSTGTPYLISNQTTATITVQTNTGAAVATIPANAAASVLFNGTAGDVSGSWYASVAASSGGVTSLSCGTTGLTPSSATSGAVTIAGTLVAANGGTGNNTYAVGDLLYASGATALSRLADVATGSALISGGVGVAPSWGKISLTTAVSGILPVANGGTALSTVPANGQLLIGNATGYTLATLTATANQTTVTNAAGSITLGLPAAIIAPGSLTTTSTLVVGTLYSDGTTTGITAAGATQGTAAALTKSYNVVTTTASGTGVVLPTATAGMRVTIVNRGANVLNVYPASGAAVDGNATNTAVTIAVNGTGTYEASSATQWYTITSSSAGVSSITGTTNQVAASASTGAVVLSTPATFVAPGSITSTSTLVTGTLYSDGTTNGIAATGSTQGTATALTTSYNVVTSVASSTGVVLPVATAGMRVTVVNRGANVLNVYPAGSAAIDGFSASAPVTLPASGTGTYEASGVAQWYTVNDIVANTGGLAITNAPSTNYILTGTSGNTATWQPQTNTSPTSTNYNFAYDTTTTQAFYGSANAFQAIAFNNPLSVNSAWTYNDSVFTCPMAGVYIFNYNCSAYATAVTNTISIRVMKNPTVYLAGTVSQSGTTVTGSGTVFTSAMVGGSIVYDNGLVGYVTAFNSGTSLTVSPSRTVASTGYTVTYGFSQTYTTGTASQSGATVTGSGTTFTAAMVGGNIIYANGIGAYITAYNSGTSLTVSPSQTISSQGFTINYDGTEILGSQAGTDLVTTSVTRTVVRDTIVSANAGDTFQVQMSGTAGGGVINLAAPTNSVGNLKVSISCSIIKIA
jgi:hypothetical protein